MWPVHVSYFIVLSCHYSQKESQKNSTESRAVAILYPGCENEGFSNNELDLYHTISDFSVCLLGLWQFDKCNAGEIHCLHEPFLVTLKF